LVTYAYNNANQLTQLTQQTQVTQYSYDNNGNLTTETSSLSGTKSYGYDFENRLIQGTVPAGGLSLSYTYSGDGRRTSSNVNGTIVKYIYDGSLTIIERDSLNNTLVTYTKNPFSLGGIGGLISSIQPALPAAGHIPDVALERGKVLDVIFDTLYYHDSNLGNVNQITDSSGAVVQTYDYDAFGNIVTQTGSLTNAYRYKTKEYSPETGLIFFGARYYNPLIGRFITKDPLGMIDGPNVYVYCGNDPVNRIDPTGKLFGPPGAIQGLISGAIQGAIAGSVTGAVSGGWKGSVGGFILGGVAGAASGWAGGWVEGAIGGKLGLLAGAIVGEVVGGLVDAPDAGGTIKSGLKNAPDTGGSKITPSIISPQPVVGANVSSLGCN